MMREIAREVAVRPIAFVLTPEERAIARTAADRQAGTLRSLMSVNGVLYVVLGACQTYAGLGGTVRGHHMSSIYLPLGIMSLGLGAATLAFVANAGWLRRHVSHRSRETTFAVDEDGITLSEGRARVVPWSRGRPHIGPR